MTTTVTVDAHAGWPVKVDAIDSYEGRSETTELAVVAPHTVQHFYATSTRQIVVTELPNVED
jgi:hypothetical protein